MFNLVSICHRCPQVDWKIPRYPPCKQNQIYFALNATAGTCPLGKFANGQLNPNVGNTDLDSYDPQQNKNDGRCCS